MCTTPVISSVVRLDRIRILSWSENFNASLVAKRAPKSWNKPANYRLRLSPVLAAVRIRSDCFILFWRTKPFGWLGGEVAVVVIPTPGAPSGFEAGGRIVAAAAAACV